MLTLYSDLFLVDFEDSLGHGRCSFSSAWGWFHCASWNAHSPSPSLLSCLFTQLTQVCKPHKGSVCSSVCVQSSLWCPSPDHRDHWSQTPDGPKTQPHLMPCHSDIIPTVTGSRASILYPASVLNYGESHPSLEPAVCLTNA